jgi:hypothetical protein
VLVAELVGDLSLFRYFGPYGIIFMTVCVITVAVIMPLRDSVPYGIFMNVCVILTVAMVMLLRDFGPYGILFMTMCLQL